MPSPPGMAHRIVHDVMITTRRSFIIEPGTIGEAFQQCGDCSATTVTPTRGNTICDWGLS